MLNKIRTSTPILALILFALAVGYTFAAKVVVVPLGGDSMPSGMVSSFNKKACPAGWKKYANARGRVVVGLQIGGTLGGLNGVPLADLENKLHNHSWGYFNDTDKRWVSYGSDSSSTIIVDWGDGIGDVESGYYPLARHDTTGAGAYYTSKSIPSSPYVQLLYCEKV